MKSWERNRLRRSYLDEWVKAIDEHGGFVVWQMLRESWRILQEEDRAKSWWQFWK
jgi:hypothetical protein